MTYKRLKTLTILWTLVVLSIVFLLISPGCRSVHVNKSAMQTTHDSIVSKTVDSTGRKEETTVTLTQETNDNTRIIKATFPGKKDTLKVGNTGAGLSKGNNTIDYRWYPEATPLIKWEDIDSIHPKIIVNSDGTITFNVTPSSLEITDHNKGTKDQLTTKQSSDTSAKHTTEISRVTDSSKSKNVNIEKKGGGFKTGLIVAFWVFVILILIVFYYRNKIKSFFKI